MAWLPGGGRGRYSGFPSGTDVFPTASARALRVSDSCVRLRAWRGFEASARCPPHEKEDYSCRYSSSLSLDSLARVFAPVTISAAKIGIPTESAKFFTEKDAVPVYGDSGRPDLPLRLPVHDSVRGQRQATCTPSKSFPPALARSQLRAWETLLRVKAKVFSCKGMEFFCAKPTCAFAKSPTTHSQKTVFVSFGRKSIHRQGQPCRKARGSKVRYDGKENLPYIKKPPQTRVWHYGQELSGLQLSVIRAVVKRSQSRTLDSFMHEDMHFGGKPEKSAAFCLMVV